jgi:hypothetical protein
MSNNYRLARIDAKTKTITDIADLSIEVRRYANEYQTKRIKTELILGFILLISCCRSFIDFKGVT